MRQRELAERVLRAREDMIDAEARTSAYAELSTLALFGSDDARRSLDGFTVAGERLTRARVFYTSVLADYFAESERVAGHDPHRSPDTEATAAFEMGAVLT